MDITLSHQLHQSFNNACTCAHIELENIISLTRALLEKEHTALPQERELARCRYLSQLFKAVDISSIKILTEIYEQLSSQARDHSLLSACRAALELLNSFYQSTLPQYTSEIQMHISSNSPIPRGIVVGFISGAEILQKNLHPYY